MWIDHQLSEADIVTYNTSLRAVRGTPSLEKGSDKHHMLILRQLCVEPALYHKHGRAVFDVTARRLTVAQPGPKLCAAIKLVRRMVFEGHVKIVVVSEFVSLLDVFGDLLLNCLGEKSTAFDGRLSAVARSAVIKDFLRGNTRVLRLSLGAGAYGLNLTPGPTVMIVLDVWFNPAVHRQVEARIHRLGQNKPVVIHTLVMRESIESAILDTHTRKEACASALISGTADENVFFSEFKTIAHACKPLMSFNPI
jgi:SNF2 family DNA or RNA helicase